MQPANQAAIKEKIFISYSHADSQWAKEFALSLRQRGVDVWLDQLEIKPGEPLSEAIERGLRGSDLVVTLINAENLSKPYLFFELGAALSMGKRIVGIVPEGFDTVKLPQSLRARRYLIKSSPDATAAELIAEKGDSRKSA
jgi:hypothetical protein